MSENEIYYMGTWAGRPRWCCRFCPYDTLDGEEAILEHYYMFHAPKPEPKIQGIIPMFDKWGNEIVPEE